MGMYRMNTAPRARLVLDDGTEFEGSGFGAARTVAGEVVFSTGIAGYPESLTDPSYKGQILILTYPLIGNYGVPDKSLWESSKIMVSGLIVSNYNNTPSHFQSKQSLGSWFKNEKLPLIQIKDTRFLTQKIRDSGSMLGKITFGKDVEYYDPNTENLVDKVSIKSLMVQTAKEVKDHRIILLIDCGTKRNIQKALLKRNI